VGVDLFQVGQMVDVTGTSQGKGFPARSSATIFPPTREPCNSSRITPRVRPGWRRDPGACFRASAWPASWGNVKRTTQSLEIVRIDAERQLLLIKGSVRRQQGRRLAGASCDQGRGEEGRCAPAKGGKK